MARRRLVILGVVLGLCGLAALGLFGVQRALVKKHVFPLTDRPAFLTEELAMEKAREALRLDGYDPDEWRPRESGVSTKAPDGRRDQFMSRNTINPNRGSFVFKRGENQARGIAVELDGDRVICESSHAK